MEYVFDGNDIYTRQKRNSNLQPWECTANMLITEPPYPLKHQQCSVRIHYNNINTNTFFVQILVG